METFTRAIQLFKTAGTDQAHPEVDKTTRKEVTAEDADSKEENGSSQIRKIFTGAALDTALLSLKNGTDEEKNSDFRIISGGATVLNTEPAEISGDTAAIQGNVETWVRSEARFDAESDWVTFEPHSQKSVTMELVKQTDGTWMVADMAWNYLPGFAP